MAKGSEYGMISKQTAEDLVYFRNYTETENRMETDHCRQLKHDICMVADIRTYALLTECREPGDSEYICVEVVQEPLLDEAMGDGAFGRILGPGEFWVRDGTLYFGRALNKDCEWPCDQADIDMNKSEVFISFAVKEDE